MQYLAISLSYTHDCSLYAWSITSITLDSRAVLFRNLKHGRWTPWRCPWLNPRVFCCGQLFKLQWGSWVLGVLVPGLLGPGPGSWVLAVIDGGGGRSKALSVAETKAVTLSAGTWTGQRLLPICTSYPPIFPPIGDFVESERGGQ
jgi:hypothetical protein